MSKECIFTEEELIQKCTEWQKVLRLQDWELKTGIYRERDFITASQGEVKWQLSNKQAAIKILDPVDYDNALMVPQDMERTLVHELLHLHFAPFVAKNDTPEDTAQEQAIHAISCALVELARRGEHDGQGNL